jgi:hypothetical protein
MSQRGSATSSIGAAVVASLISIQISFSIWQLLASSILVRSHVQPSKFVYALTSACVLRVTEETLHLHVHSVYVYVNVLY